MTDLLDGLWLYDSFAFQNALPVPTRIDTRQRSHLTMQMGETAQFLGLYDPSADPLDPQPLMTTVWGYGTSANVTYPGPTIIASEGQSLDVLWLNRLPTDGHLLPVDLSLHRASPTMRSVEDGWVPTVVHLHGGRTESASDGLPEAWFTQPGGGKGGKGPAETGPGYEKKIYTYDNEQDAATLWYHDHALGLTRLNVYAGLAGFYLLQDETKQALEAEGVLPGLDHTYEMAIQDRAFTADGQLYYPAYRNDPLPGTDETVGDIVPQTFYDEFGENAASALPEFFGDVVLVNGMAWPNVDVAQGEITASWLNGSDSRFYVLHFDNPAVRATLVGVEGGLLRKAVEIMDGEDGGLDGLPDTDEFTLLEPGGRVDVVLDFSALDDGETATLLNRGPAFEPFKGLNPDGSLAGDGVEAADADDAVGGVMRFTVDASLAPLDVSVEHDTVLIDEAAFLDITEATPDHVRRLGLFEGTDEWGRIQPLLGKAEAGDVADDRIDADAAFGPLLWEAETTETPTLGDLEFWEILNFTADAHPIHLHLVQYQVVQKVRFSFEDADEDGVPDDGGDGTIEYGYQSLGDEPGDFDIFIFDEEAVALRPEEEGWQDTVSVAPGEMLTLAARFDRPGDYVWHCHILSHEDHEMMRPVTVVEPDIV